MSAADSAAEECSITASSTVGQYDVDYLPLKSGRAAVAIMLNHIHIRGSPFPIEIAAGPADASCCVAAGSGIVEAISTVPAHFVIQVSLSIIRVFENAV